ncbi:MAG: TIR domain-containing protein [Acidimicrobiales bacterium]
MTTRRATSESPAVFLSYARTDGEHVRLFAAELERNGVRALVDVEFLQPGQRWDHVIFQQLTAADGLAVFLSPASRTSDAVAAEFMAFADAGQKPIFPILIGGADYSDLAGGLDHYQALIVRDWAELRGAAGQVARVMLERIGGTAPLSDEAKEKAARVSRGIATTIREGGRDASGTAGNAVFIVHGHDLALRDAVEETLRGFGIEPVILSKAGGGSRSLVDRFESLAHEARFAVVLLSADDMGASRRLSQYSTADTWRPQHLGADVPRGPDVGVRQDPAAILRQPARRQYDDPQRGGENTLKFRARENVILELGFFYGKLGWENVFVVQKPPEHTWPDFERPSDLAGVVFFEVTGDSNWKAELAESLQKAGLLAW